MKLSQNLSKIISLTKKIIDNIHKLVNKLNFELYEIWILDDNDEVESLEKYKFK